MSYTYLPLVFVLVISGCAVNQSNNSIAELERKAQEGDAYSQHVLGYKYNNGIDVEKNHAKGV